MAKKSFAYILFLLGLIFILIPFVSYKKAYFVNDNYYITMVDTIAERYVPYIKTMVQSERNLKANKEEVLYAKETNSLLLPAERNLFIALESRDSLAIATAKKAKKDLIYDRMDGSMKIADKWDISNMDSLELLKKIKAIRDTFSIDDFLLLTSNQTVNPKNSKTIRKIKHEDISIQKVNLQSKTPFILIGLAFLIAGTCFLLISLEIIQINDLVVKLSALGILLIGSFFLGYKSYRSLQDDIDFKEIFEEREKIVQDKLTTLKEIQVVYAKEKGKYAGNWKDLINFTKNDSAQIIKYIVNKDDTAAVNTALREGRPLEDTLYIKVKTKIFGNNIPNIDSLKFVPFSEDTFEIEADRIYQSEKWVNVMLIQTDKFKFVENLKIFPENFDNIVAPKPLISIGSLKEPTTEGNW